MRLPELWGAVLSGEWFSPWKQRECLTPRVFTRQWGGVEGFVKWWAATLTVLPCAMFRVALWVCKFSHFLEVFGVCDCQGCGVAIWEQEWITEALLRQEVHCFTYTSQLICPSYHPECQLTAFTKSFQCCRSSVYFLRLSIWVSATWRVFTAQTYLASWLLYPVISQHAAQTLETSGCWYLCPTFSELIKCLKLF